MGGVARGILEWHEWEGSMYDMLGLERGWPHRQCEQRKERDREKEREKEREREGERERERCTPRSDLEDVYTNNRQQSFLGRMLSRCLFASLSWLALLQRFETSRQAGCCVGWNKLLFQAKKARFN